MLLRLKNIIKTYHRNEGSINAVDNLSLDIPGGSFLTITGPSGSGKTTLLLIIGGLLHPTAGKMFFHDKEIDLNNDRELSRFRSNHVGFVMQSFALVPYLTAVENIMIALNVKSHNKEENAIRARQLLSWVGLDDRTTHYPRELSAGQQQRVAIARALANNPDILLADEPTGNLDPNLSNEILGILKEINQNQGTTIVMVTHSPLATQFGNMKVHLQNGRIHKNMEDVLVEQMIYQ